MLQMKVRKQMKEVLWNKALSDKKLWKRIFLFLFGILLIGMVNFIGQGTRVSGRSMENTFMEGDSLFIDKLSYRFTKPKRFDVIVFPFQEGREKVLYIKRVIGLPGETVQIAGDNIYINGNILEEDYRKEAMEEGSEGIALNPVILGEDEYFVLGDNRNFSMDSRQAQIGAVREKDIIGKCLFRFWSAGQP